MVVFKRPLNHYDDFGHRNEGVQIISSASISGKILQGTSENSLNGLLFQLSSLSLIATELFDSILQTSKGTFERISNLSTRVQHMNDKLTDIEQYMIDNNKKLLFTCMGYTFTEKSKEILNKVDQQNISPANNPTALAWQYQSNCEPVPNFEEDLNQIMSEDRKRPCIKFYSNPQFFFEHWAKKELARQKNERKMLRRKRQEEKQKKQPAKQVATIQLHYKRFDKEGNRIDEPRSSLDTSMAEMDDFSMGTPIDRRTDSFGGSTPVPSPSTPLSSSPSPAHTGTTAPLPPGPPPPGPPPGPPPTMNTGISVPKPPNGPPPPNVQPSFTPAPPPGPPPMQNHVAAPPGPPPPGPPPPPDPPMMMPPPMSTGTAPPPPPGPPPPAMPMSSGGGGLNDLISKGVTLKKTEAVERPPTQMTLLEQIRVGKKLNSAADRKIEEKPVEKTAAVSVADILGKKFENVLDDDSDSDDSEFDDDWD